MSSAAHLRHLKEVVIGYEKVLACAGELLSEGIELAPHAAADLQREVRGACHSFFANGEGVKLRDRIRGNDPRDPVRRQIYL